MSFAPRRPANLPPYSETDVYMTMSDVHWRQYVYTAKNFCRGAATILRRKGHLDFGDIGVWENSSEKRNPPRLILTFPSLAAARAYFWTYTDYVWAANDSSQFIRIKLENPLFQKELLGRTKRIAAAGGITPEIASNPELAARGFTPSLRDRDPSPPPAPGSSASSSGPLLPQVPPLRPIKGKGGKGQ